MTLATSTLTKILFSQTHYERLRIDDDPEQTLQFAVMRRLLEDWHYDVSGTTDAVTPAQLDDVKILVIGAPQGEKSDKHTFTEAEVSTIRQFVVNGGGLLLLCNQAMMPEPIAGFQALGEIAGVEFQYYFNYSLNFIKDFDPHYLTNGIERVNVGDFAALALDAQKATAIAMVGETDQTIMAASLIERGRVVTVADVNWLSDRYLQNTRSQNESLFKNIVTWLEARNAIDIESVKIPETVEWGEATTVVVNLRNNHSARRPHVECLLQSGSDALIAQSERKSRTVPPEKPTRMQWTVRPQILGEQAIWLTITARADELVTETLHFDHLPPLYAHAPGYFTLELRDSDGSAKSTFKTGEAFSVAGAFHWRYEHADRPLPEHELELIVSDGIVNRGMQLGDGSNQWYLQVTTAGRHELTLRLKESNQYHTASIFVADSYTDRVSELYAAYVCPLEAEMIERLRQLNPRLVAPAITEQPFRVLPPEEFVEAVYPSEVALWLKGLLSAAHKEQWYNHSLLRLVLTYIAPTFLPEHGSLIPYAPDLASHLAELDTGIRHNIEYNLLASDESEEIQVKQNIAAYLLHEKFGHGFFYTQTRAGQQLTILYRHGFLNSPNHDSQKSKHTDYDEVAQLIDESLLLANEGFATWLELRLLARLDRDVRNAAHARRRYLIEDAKGMYQREETSHFFSEFPSIYDSRYREVFEYLEFFEEEFNAHCAIELFRQATEIDFGIVEFEGEIRFQFEPAEIKYQLTNRDSIAWRSSARLLKIVGLLQETSDKMEQLRAAVHNRFCQTDCRDKQCPLVEYVAQQVDLKGVHYA